MFQTKVDQNGTYQLNMDDVNAWEEKNGKIPDKAVVLVSVLSVLLQHIIGVHRFQTIGKFVSSLLAFISVIPDYQV